MLQEIVLRFGEAPDQPPLRISPGSMTVLVGPNNSGKSLTLREIKRRIKQSKSTKARPYHIIDSITPCLPSSGPVRDGILAEVGEDIAPLHRSIKAAVTHTPRSVLRDFQPSQIGEIFEELHKLGFLHGLAERGRIDPALAKAIDVAKLEEQPTLHALAIEFLTQAIEYLRRNEGLLQGITQVEATAPAEGLIDKRIIRLEGYLRHFSPVTTLLDGRTRLRLTDPRPSEDLGSSPSSMMMRLFHQPVEREELRRIVYTAFQRHLALDLSGMSRTRFVLADDHPGAFEHHFGSPDGIEYFRLASDLDEFSDGVKSYVGLHATVMSQDYRVILVDEPEAFLHPPLARRLGYNLTRLAATRGASVIAATHSPAFLMGCISARRPVNIVRLGWVDNVATARALRTDTLERMMNDPLVRSSGVLNALFHRSAIVCEGDSDQAFYEEINERLRRTAEESEDRGEPTSQFARDCLFLNAHGKHSVAPLVDALRQMGIPAVGIVDLDILKNSGEVTKLLHATGSGIAITETAGQMCSRLLGYFTETSKANGRVLATGEQVPQAGRGNLDALLSQGGIESLPTTAMKEDLKSFLHLMAQRGIFVPERGDLETWLPQCSTGIKKGRRWLSIMFQRMGSLSDPSGYLAPEKGDVWDFIRRAAEWIDEHASNPPKGEGLGFGRDSADATGG